MSDQHTAMASYTLLIDADSGYTSTTEGRCTAAQYGAAIAALHSRPNTYTELNAKCDELLEALQFAIRFHDQLTPSDVERMRKIVAKATGSAT